MERLERERLERERLERERLERERLERERFEKIRQERKIKMLEKTNPHIFFNVQGKSIKIIAPKISSSQRKSINSHPLITNKSNSTDIQTKPEPKEIEQENSEKGVLKYEHFHIFSEDL
ncbi:hypothetical protein TRFO_26665 [Tritrichomonas foetus]|uniref:Uncharacterized protein n=1 Tax=Tritrichomonas foetus TaxID=1144522 RepID=A0A1J4K3H9_9EUKA|nr:hypothetical protein TRFO_26665 [Tritrichomonas foetus]|eukprot:OHT05530.1 hypothetical protein TRFO_26665 [Tritrichomonas foetus]